MLKLIRGYSTKLLITGVCGPKLMPFFRPERKIDIPILHLCGLMPLWLMRLDDDNFTPLKLVFGSNVWPQLNRIVSICLNVWFHIKAYKYADVDTRKKNFLHTKYPMPRQSENHTLLQTKMVRIYTLFRPNWPLKNISFEAAPNYIAFIMEYSPPVR